MCGSRRFYRSQRQLAPHGKRAAWGPHSNPPEPPFGGPPPFDKGAFDNVRLTPPHFSHLHVAPHGSASPDADTRSPSSCASLCPPNLFVNRLSAI